jgi:hypothetical protein
MGYSHSKAFYYYKLNVPSGVTYQNKSLQHLITLLDHDIQILEHDISYGRAKNDPFAIYSFHGYAKSEFIISHPLLQAISKKKYKKYKNKYKKSFK